MEISSDLILVFVAGLVIGILITIIFFLIWYDFQDRKVVRKKEERRLIINTIGKLCASVDNAFAAYRMGSMNFDSLKEILRSKIEEVNVQLTSNIDILDPYYVKNTERFIEDQKSFLLNKQGKEPVRSGETGIRSGSRGNYHYKETPVFPSEQAQPTVSRPAMQTEILPKEKTKPKISEPPVMLENLPLDAVTKEKAPEKKEIEPPLVIAKDNKKSVLKSDIVDEFESGATARIPANEFKKYKMPKPITPFETIPQDKTEEKTAIDIAATKEFKLETPLEEIAQPKTKSPKVKKVVKEKAPSKAKRPVDKKIIDKKIMEEKTVFDMPSYKIPKDDKKTVKGTTVFDTAIDVEATQEFNIQDIIEKTKSHIKADKKKKSDDDSLITGDDVMDQMDNLFGFGD